ncbi:MAG: hypothetical protein CME26_10430 [Gemmatimonadetes bacterium]|nr:hypothetical protein [Gemmatimonadota bacterium]|tara:strand:- start:4236 stop:5108 length:873 start_codon:yes stop_codon:yes gene_type:complete
MPNRYTMTDDEKYYFDLRGYLIVRGALSDREVSLGNEAIDRHASGMRERPPGLGGTSSVLSTPTGRLELSGMLGWPEPDRTLFRRLLIHPVVVSRLNELCGPGFRLDHGPGLIGGNKGAEGFTLHGGGEPFSHANWYRVQNGRIRCRGITVAWQFTDCGPGDGGFAVVPGSHKSEFEAPVDLRSVENPEDLVVQPVMKAGDVLFFAETATHGTLPWKAEHQRRSVLYKYASRGAARAVGRRYTPESRYGDWVKDLTPEQHSLLYGPGYHSGASHRANLGSDGKKVWLVDG